MSTIELVATAEAILLYFPDRLEDLKNNAGPHSADFPIDPAQCETALGSWLASTVTSTRFNKAGANCSLISQDEGFGTRLSLLCQRVELMSCSTVDAARRVLDTMAAWVEHERRCVETQSWQDASISKYKWPVFGSVASQSVHTPERYMDFCGRAMIAQGAIVRDVNGSEPPQYLQLMMLAAAQKRRLRKEPVHV